MKLNIAKLLPKNIQNEQWKNLFNSVKYILTQLYEQKVNLIKKDINSFINDKEVLKDILYQYGFDAPVGEGYVDSLLYYQRQLYSIIPKILKKTTLEAYQHLFYIYNLNGYVYPTFYGRDDSITPWLDWVTTPETSEDNLTLDYEVVVDDITYPNTVLDAEKDNLLYINPIHNHEHTFDADPLISFDQAGIQFDDFTYVNVYAQPRNSGLFPWYLDFFNYIGSMTPYIILTMSYNNIENEDEFLSEYTLEALKNEIMNSKHYREIPHIQINHTIDAAITGQVTKRNYSNEDKTIHALQLSVFQEGTTESPQYLRDITSIKFGTGSLKYIENEVYTLPGNILDLADTTSEIDYDIDSTNIIVTSDSDETTRLHLHETIFEKSTLHSFTEVGLFDSNGSCIIYATFPEIRLKDIYGSWALNFNLVESNE